MLLSNKQVILRQGIASISLSSEPKYADPIVGSSPSFQSRLAELASLEAETVRWERMRKLKKKPRED